MVKSDVLVTHADVFKVDTVCRTPLKFGAVVVDKLPAAYARATVVNRKGQTAHGWGAMFLMDLWAWPVSRAGHEPKNQAIGIAR